MRNGDWKLGSKNLKNQNKKKNIKCYKLNY